MGKNPFGSRDNNFRKHKKSKDAEKAIQEALDNGATKLDLGWHELKEAPTSLLELAPQLKALSLRGNDLASLPPLEVFTGLEYLDVSHNKIEELPASIGLLTSLTFLSVSSNELYELPDSLGKLVNLETLSVGYNKLTVMSEEIGNLTNLETLSWVHNNLKVLPKFVGNFQSLKILMISQNGLKELPTSLATLKKLEHFLAFSNQLETEALLNIPKGLSYLNVDDNPNVDYSKLPLWVKQHIFRP